MSAKGGGLSLELHILPAEPFFAPEAVANHQATQGMIAVGGANPVNVDDPVVRPNHHLVVHIFHQDSGAAVTNAQVKITYQPTDRDGHPSGPMTTLPVTVMQAIGKGGPSTHYGNNTHLAAGYYRINVTVDGHDYPFFVNVRAP